MTNHIVHPQDLSWTEDECKELIAVEEAVKRLNNNSDFQLFKQQYIDKQRKVWEKHLVSFTLGSKERQEAIERLIGIGNLENYLDTREELSKKAKMYLDDIRKSKSKAGKE